MLNDRSQEDIQSLVDFCLAANAYTHLCVDIPKWSELASGWRFCAMMALMGVECARREGKEVLRAEQLERLFVEASGSPLPPD